MVITAQLWADMVRDEQWVCRYDPSTGFVGLYHPAGGAHSLCEVFDHSIGHMIVDAFTRGASGVRQDCGLVELAELSRDRSSRSRSIDRRGSSPESDRESIKSPGFPLVMRIFLGGESHDH